MKSGKIKKNEAGVVRVACPHCGALAANPREDESIDWAERDFDSRQFPLRHCPWCDNEFKVPKSPFASARP
jgi:ssDNA-binding Zn-finger/Zn-ribbon topoisomerase 1